MGNKLKMHVWIHSEETTGKCMSVEVFDIDGRVNMQWFYDVFEGKNNNQDLANQFYECLGHVDCSAWFEVKEEYETACDPPEAYIDVLCLATKPEE